MTRTVLITGASTGIGKATAEHFHTAGWNVVATMRSPDESRNGERLLVTRLDVTEPGSVEEALRRAHDRFGDIDVVVNNAGYGLVGTFESMGEGQIKRQFDTNVFGLMRVTRAVMPRMRERKAGTIELLLTLPVTMAQAVLGKFLAAWAFVALALAGTFPIWLTVNLLGDPDNGIILAAYLGSLLMAGAYLAVSVCVSAATKSQVIAFIIALVLCFAFTLAGFPLVLDAFAAWLPDGVVNAIASLSFLTHFQSLQKGVIDLRDIVFFAAFIAAWLYACALIVDARKAD